MIAGLILCLVFIGVFVVRAGRHMPRRTLNDPIRMWMNVPYIAKSYGMPVSVLQEAIGLPPSPPDRRPLSRIARAQNRPVQSLIDSLYQTIEQTEPSLPTRPPVTPKPTQGAP